MTTGSNSQSKEEVTVNKVTYTCFDISSDLSLAARIKINNHIKKLLCIDVSGNDDIWSRLEQISSVKLSYKESVEKIIELFSVLLNLCDTVALIMDEGYDPNVLVKFISDLVYNLFGHDIIEDDKSSLRVNGWIEAFITVTTSKIVEGVIKPLHVEHDVLVEFEYAVNVSEAASFILSDFCSPFLRFDTGLSWTERTEMAYLYLSLSENEDLPSHPRQAKRAIEQALNATEQSPEPELVSKQASEQVLEICDKRYNEDNQNYNGTGYWHNHTNDGWYDYYNRPIKHVLPVLSNTN